MKKSILTLIACLFLSLALVAQSDFVHYKGKGQALLKDGTTVTGFIEYCLEFPGKVYVTPEGQSKDTKYDADDVKSFNIDDKQFVSVKAADAAAGPPKVTFLRFLTPADYKIRILIQETQPVIVSNNDFTITTTYFCMLPGDDANAYAVGEMKFVPFKKMNNYIANCPALVARIEAKDKEVYVPSITTDDIRREVFLKVAEEYQNCK
jgi:hypothetical protein